MGEGVRWSCDRLHLVQQNEAEWDVQKTKRKKKKAILLGWIYVISVLLQIWSKTILLRWICDAKNVEVGQEHRSMRWLNCLYYREANRMEIVCSGHRLHITEGGFCLISGKNLKKKKTGKRFQIYHTTWRYPVGFAVSPLIKPITRVWKRVCP